MRAIVSHEPGVAGLSLDEVAAPLAGPGEALVEVEACGIGGTVLKKVNSLPAELRPRIPGHEIVGRVVACGAGVSSPRPGDRVMAYYYVACGTCRSCRLGHPARCVSYEQAGRRVGEHLDGGFAPLVALPAAGLLPVPAGLSAREATVAPDALATPLHIASVTRLEPGERLLILGAAGGVGIHLVQLARAMGAEVFGVDTADKVGLVVDQVPSAHWISAADDWPDQLVGEVDAVADFVGAEGPLRQVLPCLRPGGRLALLTTGPGPALPFTSHDLVARELSVIGSKYATYGEVLRAAELLAQGVVRAVVTTEGGLDTVVGQLAAIDAGTTVGRGVLTW